MTDYCHWCGAYVDWDSDTDPGVEIALLKGPLDKVDRIVAAHIECCEGQDSGGTRWEMA